MADEEVQEQEGAPAQTEEAPQDQTGSQEQTADEGGGASLLSPEGFIMMSIAGIIDIIGIGLVLFGLDDFFITDFIAYCTIGLWMLFRGSRPQMETRGAQAEARTAKMAGRSKWLRPVAFIGEVIPYVGALPLWTFMVYSELQT
ncbi:MAG: hypothetical protein HY458_01900 [Parcubacteria group bacterium]|nr:hypothetical protein [Parcubacteria group bacterium]